MLLIKSGHLKLLLAEQNLSVGNLKYIFLLKAFTTTLIVIKLTSLPSTLGLNFEERNLKQYIKQNKKKLGKSIEIRPQYINDRSEFGHWEGDTVVDKNCNSILVLQERTSRKGILIKLKKHTSEEVNRQLQILKNKFGRLFKNIFKTITFDNGSEFYKTIEFENKDLQIYFTHPYCSFEKGGVENLNGIIRRYIPKGKNLKEITRQKLKAINEQIDNTPRKILNYKTAKEYFEEKCMLVN